MTTLPASGQSGQDGPDCDRGHDCDRTPPAFVAEVARAALSYDTHAHTDATVTAARRLAARESHSDADLRLLIRLSEEYGTHPVRSALAGSTAGRDWALGLLQATHTPEHLEPTRVKRLSQRLTALDRELQAALETAANLALERAVIRMGHKVKAAARKVVRNPNSELIRAAFDADVRQVKHFLPIAVRAVLTLDEEAAVREMLTEDLADEVRRLFAAGNRRALAEMAAALGVSVEALQDRFPTPFEERSESALALLTTVVGTLALGRLNSAEAVELAEDGLPITAVVPVGIARDAMLALGGAATTPAGGLLRDDDGNLLGADGTAVRSEGAFSSEESLRAMEAALADEGRPVRFETVYTWRHVSPPDSANSRHAALDGVEWSNEAERAARIGRNRIGSHAGCECYVTTELRPVPVPT